MLERNIIRLYVSVFATTFMTLDEVSKVTVVSGMGASFGVWFAGRGCRFRFRAGTGSIR
jgi:hypothetical protein